MMHDTPDFYALIHKNSKYAGQDDDTPFPVSLAHDASGYIWSGNENRYRMTDLLLLRPAEDPTDATKSIPVELEFDETPVTEEAAEAAWQEELRRTQWFTPLPHQCTEDGVFYIHRQGRRLSRAEAARIRERKESIHLVKDKGEQ